MVYAVHLSTQFICKIHSPNVQLFDYPIVHLISIIFTMATLVFAHIVPSVQNFFLLMLNPMPGHGYLLHVLQTSNDMSFP